jgi:glutamate dehydrogenase
VPDLPLPLPYAEIYVYAVEFEGIHLRGGRVARGGIRWSDRGEDYRVEVLGLMKAQMAKNTVIVPVGSKGGFFIRSKQGSMSKVEYQQYVVSCYKNFLRGLLDITDTICSGAPVHPKDTVIYDDYDPYLVVAADKGTASFSDYANSVSKEYGFWLGDAFASGGSAGYDHKKMAITSRGGWISVVRHFTESGVDVTKRSITAIGIGDMSGDVFGNGMLRSDNIKLIAAFNHIHIFLDPNPDPKISFDERKRLFNLPESKWSDYNSSLISQGGGVFERSLKTIEVSDEVCTALGIAYDTSKKQCVILSPDELIRHILKAPVDLLWNGGIGTYVKASDEENYAIGDKNNDKLRVNALEVRANVIGEGGNLGMSQKGRIEYAMNGGHVNTDFIDNSGGVDCSDHEVNIKIAFGLAMSDGALSVEERNSLLVSMRDEVGELVLEDNTDQTLAISMMQHISHFTVDHFIHLIHLLENKVSLDRNVEFIPSDEQIIERKKRNQKLTRPELAVLMAYSKMYVFEELMHTNLSEDKYFESVLIAYFPTPMCEKFQKYILEHPLRKEIICTKITNNIVNNMSGVSISLIQSDTSASLKDIVVAFYAIKEIFNIENLIFQVESYSNTLSLDVQTSIFAELNKMLRRATTWVLNNLDVSAGICNIVERYKHPVGWLFSNIDHSVSNIGNDTFADQISKYTASGVDEVLSVKIANLEIAVSMFDITMISNSTGLSTVMVTDLYFKVGSQFFMVMLRKVCDHLMFGSSYLQRMAIQTIKDDLYDKQRRLTACIINSNILERYDEWYREYSAQESSFICFINSIEVENIDMNAIILASKKLELFLRSIK